MEEKDQHCRHEERRGYLFLKEREADSWTARYRKHNTICMCVSDFILGDSGGYFQWDRRTSDLCLEDSLDNHMTVDMESCHITIIDVSPLWMMMLRLQKQEEEREQV